MTCENSGTYFETKEQQLNPPCTPRISKETTAQHKTPGDTCGRAGLARWRWRSRWRSARGAELVSVSAGEMSSPPRLRLGHGCATHADGVHIKGAREPKTTQHRHKKKINKSAHTWTRRASERMLVVDAHSVSPVQPPHHQHRRSVRGDLTLWCACVPVSPQEPTESYQLNDLWWPRSWRIALDCPKPPALFSSTHTQSACRRAARFWVPGIPERMIWPEQEQQNLIFTMNI